MGNGAEGRKSGGWRRLYLNALIKLIKTAARAVLRSVHCLGDCSLVSSELAVLSRARPFHRGGGSGLPAEDTLLAMGLAQ